MGELRYLAKLNADLLNRTIGQLFSSVWCRFVSYPRDFVNVPIANLKVNMIHSRGRKMESTTRCCPLPIIVPCSLGDSRKSARGYCRTEWEFFRVRSETVPCQKRTRIMLPGVYSWSLKAPNKTIRIDTRRAVHGKVIGHSLHHVPAAGFSKHFKRDPRYRIVQG